jgi:hypothetical protein
VQLLVVILHHEEVLDDVLSSLVEFELVDAVVIESRTGLELLERDLPVFAGVRALVPGGLDFCRLVLCLVGDDETARQALAALPRAPSAPAPGEPRTVGMLLPVTDVRTL